MRYVLDTSVVIRGVPAYEAEAAISVATLAELHFGILSARSPETRAKRLGLFALVNDTFASLPFDEPVAAAYGELAAAVKAHGRSPRGRAFDLLIAATAMVHSASVVTANVDDLRGVEHLVDVVAL